jgi:NadR type nicotinamide-nucleotide adenylyltransferase
VLVDKARVLVPVSGTMVRADPLAHLHQLEPQVRAHFVKRVCLLGAESTGKTTMARALAEHYQTVTVPEFGRGWTEAGRGDPLVPWRSEEFVQIGRMQRWLEDELAGQANRLLVCDTDAETTAAFHELYLDAEAPTELKQLVAEERYDLYLLCDVATPFAQDGYRVEGDHRQQMDAHYRCFLDSRGACYVELIGTHAERLTIATAAIDGLLRLSAAA